MTKLHFLSVKERVRKRGGKREREVREEERKKERGGVFVFEGWH